MRGRVDLVFADRPHGLSIVDLKTGKYSSQHAQQLHYYALLFIENGIGISDLAIIYWRPDSVPQVHRIAIDVNTLDALRQEAIETYHAIAAQHIPDELIVPVHGTTFVDSDLGIAEGTEVAIRPEQVATDDGTTVWGLRVYGTEGPLGWIPDSLKTRIRASSAKVFGSRSTNERRNGYIRLSIATS
ncbi:MAG: PD-(D/E)XK nuclease family protein, partial [Candidatus Methanomethylicaceae archaeon]